MNGNDNWIRTPVSLSNLELEPIPGDRSLEFAHVSHVLFRIVAFAALLLTQTCTSTKFFCIVCVHFIDVLRSHRYLFVFLLTQIKFVFVASQSNALASEDMVLLFCDIDVLAPRISFRLVHDTNSLIA